MQSEPIFCLGESVFAKYKVEQAPERTKLLKKCFNFDISCAKLDRVCKGNETEMKQVQTVLWKHYQKLVNIFLYQIRRDNLGVIGWVDFTTYCRMAGIIDEKTLQTDQFDRAFISTNMNSHGLISSAERNLQRYEFLEILVRLAKIKYIETGRMKNAGDALELML